MATLVVVLRLLHILAGVFWVGAALFMTFMVGPTLKQVGPSAGPVMAELNRRRYSDWLFGAAVVVLGSGLALLWIVSAHLSRRWLLSDMGITLEVGAVAAVLAIVIGATRIRPMSSRMASLQRAIAMEKRPPTPVEQAAIGAMLGNLTAWSTRTAVLLVVAAGAMGVARYL